MAVQLGRELHKREMAAPFGFDEAYVELGDVERVWDLGPGAAGYREVDVAAAATIASADGSGESTKLCVSYQSARASGVGAFLGLLRIRLRSARRRSCDAVTCQNRLTVSMIARSRAAVAPVGREEVMGASASCGACRR